MPGISRYIRLRSNTCQFEVGGWKLNKYGDNDTSRVHLCISFCYCYLLYVHQRSVQIYPLFSLPSPLPLFQPAGAPSKPLCIIYHHVLLFSCCTQNNVIVVIFVWSCSSWTNRCGEGLPALLGSAEEGRDEAMLGGLQDGIPVY